MVSAILYGPTGQSFGQEESRKFLSYKRSYYISRMLADVGVLSAVVPNCIKANQHEKFFTSYGIFLLDKIAPVIGTIKEIEFGVTEKHLGKKVAQMVATVGKSNMAAVFQLTNQKFKKTQPFDLPRVCSNFRKQIEKREIDFEGNALKYLDVLKKYDIEEYNNATSLIKVMIEVLKKLEKLKGSKKIVFRLLMPLNFSVPNFLSEPQQHQGFGTVAL